MSKLYQIFIKGLFPAILLFALSVNIAADNKILLPELGDRSSAIISPQQEYQLGQSWLHAYYSRTRIERDYVFQEYLENLTRKLAVHAKLPQKDVHVLLVDSPTLNAFAVPGGIMGIHSGLLLYASNEHELSSVIGHELAHLSQRHFARSVEASRASSVVSLAALLASIALAVAAPDAGLAALSLTQSLVQEQYLRYSRQNEQEADRIGMDILLQSNLNPEAVANMFNHMLRLTHKVGFRPPEYLLTHPLPESRISDAELRAQKLPKRYYPNNEYYDLMQVHAQIKASKSPHDSLQRYRAELNREPELIDKQYAYAKMLLMTNEPDKAQSLIEDLLKAQPKNTAFNALAIQTANKQKRFDDAKKIAKRYFAINPTSYSIGMYYAETLKLNNEYDAAVKQLERMVRLKPKEPAVWYEYAEVLGLQGDILQLHQARAQYFILTGFYNQAIRQLQYAKPLVRGDYIERAVIDEKIGYIIKLQESQQF